MGWDEVASASVATELFDGTLTAGQSTPLLGVDTFASLALWARFGTGGATTRGALQLTWSDPNSAGGQSIPGPWVSADAAWAVESSLYTVPVRAPALTIRNTGAAPATLTVSGAQRQVTKFGIVAAESSVGFVMTAAHTTVGAEVPFQPAAGLPQQTRYNGATQLVFTNPTAGTVATIWATYVDAAGNTVRSSWTAGTSLSSTYNHPSVPVRWSAAVTGSSTVPSTSTLTISQT